MCFVINQRTLSFFISFFFILPRSISLTPTLPHSHLSLIMHWTLPFSAMSTFIIVAFISLLMHYIRMFIVNIHSLRNRVKEKDEQEYEFAVFTLSMFHKTFGEMR